MCESVCGCFCVCVDVVLVCVYVTCSCNVDTKGYICMLTKVILSLR